MLSTVPEAETPSTVPHKCTGIFVPVPPSVQLPPICTELVVDACPVVTPLAMTAAAVSIIYPPERLVAPFIVVWTYQPFATTPVACPTIKLQSKLHVATISG